jgi:Carbohydrate esterase, sialic acid-specific acetylesterase
MNLRSPPYGPRLSAALALICALQLTLTALAAPASFTLNYSTSGNGAVLMPSGDSWNTAGFWWDGTNDGGPPASTLASEFPGVPFVVPPGSLLRTTSGALATTFPGSELDLEGNGVFVNDTGNVNDTAALLACKQGSSATNTGEIYFTNLVVNGGRIDDGVSSIPVFDGHLTIGTNNAYFYADPTAGDRGFQVNSVISGNGIIELYLYSGQTAFQAAYTNDLDITGANNPFAGTWRVLQGVLLGSGTNSLGTNSIAVETNGALETMYDLNSPAATLTLNGRMFLHQQDTFSNVIVAGVTLPLGTYTWAQLNAYSPTSFPATWTQQYGSSSNSASGGLTVLSGSGVFTTNPPQTNLIIKAFLQGGQSNSDGRALTNGLPPALLSPQPDVVIYYGDTDTFTDLQPGLSSAADSFGPELTFGQGLSSFYNLTNRVSTNNVMVAIIKYAVGGTSLYYDWAAGGTASTKGDGPNYIEFQDSVAAGVRELTSVFPGATIELDGMIWVQGETDIDLSSGATGVSTNPAIAAAYGTNLVRFINDVRLTYATNRPYGTNLPFFLSRISTNQTAFSNPANAAFPYYLEVRAGQALAAATLANTFMIDTDGSQFSVGTIGEEAEGKQHYDTGGQQALGSAFAQAVLAALPRPVMQSVVRSQNAWLVSFVGSSGLNYSFERATSLWGPWSALTNTVMGPSGQAAFYDPTSNASAFYRVSYP